MFSAGQRSLSVRGADASPQEWAVEFKPGVPLRDPTGRDVSHAIGRDESLYNLDERCPKLCTPDCRKSEDIFGELDGLRNRQWNQISAARSATPATGDSTLRGAYLSLDCLANNISNVAGQWHKIRYSCLIAAGLNAELQWLARNIVTLCAAGA